MTRSLVAVSLVLGLALSGCGYNKGDRALTGGAIGAAGAATGALTDPHDVNLGRPIYK